jgi:hypothetical protein
MYWIFLLIFIITVLVPDIIRDGISIVSETRAEEILIFLMGALAFIIFIKNEQQLIFHKKEKEKDRKRIEQTVKDLVESYSYIGEVNRKMDILMNIALGLSDQTIISKAREDETYGSIVSAANFLLKADFTTLRFLNTKTSRSEKDFTFKGKNPNLKNEELINMGENISIKKYADCLAVSSPREIRGIKSYLLICGYDSDEENNPKNMEILKLFASQALFFYSYTHSQNISETISRN